VAKRVTDASDIKFPVPDYDIVAPLTFKATSEKELSPKINKLLINAAIKFFTPYGIPITTMYDATVEMTSDVTAQVTFVKRDNPDVTLILSDIYFDEATGDILQAIPTLGDGG